MLRFAVAMAVFLAACLVAQEASAQTDADIARAVRTVRNAERMMLPSLMHPTTVVVEEGGERIQAALRILNLPGSRDGDLIARITDEFVRQDAAENLFGFKFGVGLSVTTNRRKGAIKDVVVDSNRIVRVTREADSSIGYLLEAHYFFVPNRPFLNLESGSWGIGPFVAIQAGNEKALSGLGFGLMIGFRQPSSIPAANLSWNFGVGAIYDPSVKVLGNGLVADLPLPVGDSLRTTEVGSWGLMLLSSFNF